MFNLLFSKKKKTSFIVFNQTRDRCQQNQYLNETTTASEDINVTADVSTDTDTDYLTLNTFKVSGINQSAKAFDAPVVMHDPILTGLTLIAYELQVFKKDCTSIDYRINVCLLNFPFRKLRLFLTFFEREGSTSRNIPY